MISMAKLLNKKKENSKTAFDNKSNNKKKLLLFVTIVSHGHGDEIVELLKNLKVSAQFVQRAHGTASSTITDMLGFEDNGKDVVLSIVKKEDISLIKKDIARYFDSSKRNKGVAFSISMTSIVGIAAYRFLANV